MNNLHDQLAVKTGLGKRVLTSAPGAPTTCSSPLLFSPAIPQLKTKIYHLLDEHGNIRNVGKTGKALEYRLAGHIYEARSGIKNHRCNWIRSMLAKGLKPTIELQTEVKGDGCKAEIAYIAYYRKMGFDLVNGTIGGEGVKIQPTLLPQKEPIIIKLSIVKKILRLECSSDTLALYWFYSYYTPSSWKPPCALCVQNMQTMRELKIGLPRLLRAKKNLIRLKLIKQRN